jgi:hypothetical protein
MEKLFNAMFGHDLINLSLCFAYFFVGTFLFLFIYLFQGALFGRRWLHINSYLWLFLSVTFLSIFGTAFVQILLWIGEPGQKWSLFLVIPYQLCAGILNSTLVDKGRAFVDIVPGRFLMLYSFNIIATAHLTPAIILLINWSMGDY